ncbi:AAA family ATPase [Hydrogenimonas sp.]
MRNPFRFDVEVSGSYFCGREEEIEMILEYIKNQTNLIMFAKRRVGKSSLIKEIFEHRLEKGMLYAHVDIYAVSNIRELYERLRAGIEEAIARSESSLERLARLVGELQELFVGAKVSLVVSGTPKVQIESTQRDYYGAIRDLFEGFFAFLQKKDRRAVIAIDEFQKIVSLPESERVETLLRTIVNKRVNCSFLFTGSKRNILLAMFNDAGRAFFKLGAETPLDPIDEEEFYEWTRKRFLRKSVHLEREAFAHLYRESDGETRFIQQVCHELFRSQKSESVIDTGTMERTIREVIGRKSFFGQYLDSFSPAQQNTLKIVAVTDGREIYASEVLEAYETSKSTAQSAVKSLTQKGVLFTEADGRLSFEDVEFRLWLKYGAL